jgi:hypothetical protein
MEKGIKFTCRLLARQGNRPIFMADGGAGYLPPLIDKRLDLLGGKGPRPPLQAAYRRTNKVMMTLLAISVSWLSVVMIYVIAGSDRRERRF